MKLGILEAPVDRGLVEILRLVWFILTNLKIQTYAYSQADNNTWRKWLNS